MPRRGDGNHTPYTSIVVRHQRFEFGTARHIVARNPYIVVRPRCYSEEAIERTYIDIQQGPSAAVPVTDLPGATENPYIVRRDGRYYVVAGTVDKCAHTRHHTPCGWAVG